MIHLKELVYKIMAYFYNNWNIEGKLAKISEFPSEDISTLCPVPNAIEEHSPNPARHKLLMSRYEAFTMFTNQQIKE